mmetsp:Transcript_26793/g.63340  ORF Transcript_26793/g.63340 Transcript_26793/m.63340 type:complete len:234 (-) Transcript_26793:11-712(-)
MPRIVTVYCAPPLPPPPPSAAALACLLSIIVAWTTLTAGGSLLRLLSAMSCAGRGVSRTVVVAAAAAAAAPPCSPSSSELPLSPSCVWPSSQPGGRRLRLPSLGSAASTMPCTRRSGNEGTGSTGIGVPASSTACTVAKVIGVPSSMHVGGSCERTGSERACFCPPPLLATTGLISLDRFSRWPPPPPPPTPALPLPPPPPPPPPLPEALLPGRWPTCVRWPARWEAAELFSW